MIVTTVVVLAAERSEAVDELLAARALFWARSAVGTGAAVRVAEAGEEMVDALRAAGVDGSPPDGWPLVVIAPALPVWSDELAGAVLSDLDDGCPLAIGPIFDGGFYLLALARPIPSLADLSEQELTGRHGMNALIELAARDGLEVGLLRTERGLRRPADVRALLADPLTDAELRRLLAA